MLCAPRPCGLAVTTQSDRAPVWVDCTAVFRLRRGSAAEVTRVCARREQYSLLQAHGECGACD